MTVRGLGSSNEAAADPAATTPEHAATKQAATPRATVSERPKPLSGKVSPGVGRGAVALDPVPVPAKAADLREAVEIMNVILDLVRDKPVEYAVIGENAGELAINFSNAVRNVLMIGTHGDVRDEALGRAADALDAACYRDTNYTLEQRGVNALRLRAATDHARQYMALQFQKAPANAPAKQEAIRANIVKWIEPHKNELKGGYNVGHEVFKRLDAATRNRGPDEVALLLARLYDEYGHGRFPISLDLPATDIDNLESRLPGARKSSDVDKAVDKTVDKTVDKAKVLIALYRNRYLERPR